MTEIDVFTIKQVIYSLVDDLVASGMDSEEVYAYASDTIPSNMLTIGRLWVLRRLKEKGLIQ